MALRSRAFADNAPGSFFVERSSIDCGTCYELVGEVFEAADGHARVRRQPRDTVRGGVAMLVLSHRDDVADHAAIRRRFGCTRVMHRAGSWSAACAACAPCDGSDRNRPRPRPLAGLIQA